MAKIVDEIAALAAKDGVKTKEELEQKLSELRSLNWRILECIIYVRFHQQCSLADAKDMLLNSAAWIDQKVAFMNHQQEQLDEAFGVDSKDGLQGKTVYWPGSDQNTIKNKI